MSQAGSFFISAGGTGFLATLSGNVGVAVPDGADNIAVVGGHDINTAGAGSTLTINVNNFITLGDVTPIAAGSPALTAVTGDVTISAGDLNIPNTTSATSGVIQFGGARFIHNFGTSSIFIGNNAGNFTFATTNNIAIGTNALVNNIAGTNNTGIGFDVFSNVVVGSNNCAFGTNALANNDASFNAAFGINAMQAGLGAANCAFGSNALIDSGGEANIAIGTDNVANHGTLGQLALGNYNIAIGSASGYNYTGAESSNILVQNLGTLGESNIMRLGTSGAGNKQVNNCYIAGITGVNVGSVASVVAISGDHLGVTTITAGSNISVTPGANTITIAANGGAQSVKYTPVNYAASPYTVLATDYYLGVNVTGGAVSILLPNAPTTGRTFVVKDSVGLAATSNIKVTTVGGVVTIDGAATFVMNANFEAIQLIFNGTSYEVF